MGVEFPVEAIFDARRGDKGEYTGGIAALC